MPQWNVQVLGPIRAWRDGQELDLGAAGRRTLFGLLILARGHPVSRAELVDVLWDDWPPPTAANIIQGYVKHLRQQLEPDRRPRSPSEVLPAVGEGYALRIPHDNIDLERFRTLTSAAVAARRDDDLRRAQALFGQALQLWRGDPMADVPLLTNRPKALALTGERQAAQARYCETMLDLGAVAEVLPMVREMAAEQPFDEAAQARLIRAYQAVGQRAEAFAAYHTVRARLADELSVEPGPLIAAAHAALLRDSPAEESAHPIGKPAPAEARVISPAPVPAVTPAQLPADVYGFTGRRSELRWLDQLLPAEHTSRQVPDTPDPVVIAAICGTAGAGKTALAVRWAHRVRRRFADGQLYVNLRGYDDGHPESVGDALTRLLTALGVPGKDIPADLDERAARYRTALTDRAVLVVLDNAASVEQVRPLLPSTPPTMALVTSRNSLAGLVALHGVRRLTLGSLPLDDTISLLQLLIGPRADADPEAVTALAEQCARLPLALRVVAELAATRPDDRLIDLVDDLSDHRRRIRRLDAGGDSRAAVRTVFSWSYRHLSATQAAAFRRLGLMVDANIGLHAAAALTGLDADQADHALTALTRAHLVQPVERSRWTMHDLLRAYAAQVCQAEETEAERTAALARLLDHYLATAAAAMDVLYPAERHHRPVIQPPDHRVPIPTLDNREAAREWLDAERATLVAICRYAATHGWQRHAMLLSTMLYRYLEGSHHLDALDIHTHALEAACLIGDEVGQAHALTNLGAVHRLQSRYSEAIDHLGRALALHRDNRDWYGQARTRSNLGIVYERLGQHGPAIEHQQQALDLYRQLEDRYGEAGALTNLGNVYSEVNRYEEAARHLEQSLGLFRTLGDPVGEAIGLCNLGDVQRELGRYEQASTSLQRALSLFRAAGHPNGEAAALSNLGRVHTWLGRYDLAVETLGQALDWFQEAGHRYGEASVLNSLGDVQRISGHTPDALARYQAALAIGIETGDRDEQARAQQGISLCDAAPLPASQLAPHG